MMLFALLIFSSVPILFFFFLSEEIRQKAKLRKSFLLFLEYILFEIENFNRDQKQIFEGFEDPILEKEGFLTILRQEVKDMPCNALFRVVKERSSSFGFSPQISEKILLFAEHFGMQSKTNQLEEIKGTIRLLKEEIEKEKTETENKIRTTRMIGITAGIGILILML